MAASAAVFCAVSEGDVVGYTSISPQLSTRERSLPTSSKHEVDPLTAEQVVLLADVIDPRYRLFVMLGAQAGLRYAEIAGLHISNVQQFGSGGGLIAVTQQLRRDGTLGACKTKASERTIGVGAALIEEFVRHTEHYPASRTGLVIAAPAGGPLRYSNLRRRIWEPAMQQMVDKLGSDFHPRGTHQLRHTHAALLISQNIHPSVIKDRLGHASIKTTLDTYGHLYPNADQAAADALDELFAAAAPVPSMDNVIAGQFGLADHTLTKSGA